MKRMFVVIEAPDEASPVDVATDLAGFGPYMGDPTVYESLWALVQDAEPSVCIAGNPTRGDLPCGDPECVCA